MECDKRMTGILIHTFAIAHALTAALLAQTLVGDEAALTALTVAMIISVAKRLKGRLKKMNKYLAIYNNPVSLF